MEKVGPRRRGRGGAEQRKSRERAEKAQGRGREKDRGGAEKGQKIRNQTNRDCVPVPHRITGRVVGVLDDELHVVPVDWGSIMFFCLLFVLVTFKAA